MPFSILLFVLLVSGYLFLFSSSALAQCPVCVVTVGGGMLIAKKLGIDDLLVSIWISALNVAIAFWLAPKIKIKFLNNPHILTILMFVTTLYYFQFTGQIGHETNKLLGIDKILFGQTLGLLVMTLANHTYQFIKKKRGSTPFPYAKVVFPLGTVLLITLIFKSVFNL